jgi:hypothetical protein
MPEILSQSPGQQVTIVLQTTFGGSRSDGYGTPVVNRIIFPNLAMASGYPQPMTRVDTGLYRFVFTLPTGATAVGSYIVDVTYTSPATGNPIQTFFQVVVTAPFGSYSISTF